MDFTNKLFPSPITNTMIVSYEMYDKIKRDIPTTEKNEAFLTTLNGIEIVPEKYCSTNTAYLFDEEGKMTIVIFEETE